MPKFLTQEWLDLQSEVATTLPERPGLSGRLQYKVTGGPDGDVTLHMVFVDGRLAESALGEDPKTDCAFTVPYADFADVARGELDPNVAYMQGRLKMAGDMGTVLRLMPLMHSDEYKANADKVSAQTDY